MRAACAVELIHAYSLVHDDMPCMDNDVLRRGKPTVHVKFGEAEALLAGDALQALAFELLTPEGDGVPPRDAGHAVPPAGARRRHEGMAGGQAIDLASVGLALDEGAAARDAPPEDRRAAAGQRDDGRGLRRRASSRARSTRLRDYGAAMGLAFQVVDDILDVTADSATLGKTAGKDAAARQADLRVAAGAGRARAPTRSELLGEALAALARSGLADTAALCRRWPRMVVERDN